MAPSKAGTGMQAKSEKAGAKGSLSGAFLRRPGVTGGGRRWEEHTSGRYSLPVASIEVSVGASRVVWAEKRVFLIESR
jgi:hypothetical protein